MTATILPNGKNQFIGGNGVPLAGGTVAFYVPNTTTPKNTWQDSLQTILNTNPIILDASGEAIIYGSGQYRQVVKDASGNLIWDQLTASTNINNTGYINVLSISGVVGNGINDDTAGLQTAFNMGGTIFFPPGHYIITGAGIAVFGLSGINIVFASGVIFDMSGCSTPGSPNAPFSNVVYGMSFHGSIGSPVSLTGNAAAGTLSATITSAAGFSANNWVYLQSTALYETNTNVKYGEWAQIKSISSNTLTFYEPLYLSYNTAASATVKLMTPAQNIKISGQAQILGGNLSGAIFQAGIGFVYCQNFQVNDVNLNYLDYCGIQAYKSRDGFYKNASCTNISVLRSGFGVGFSADYGCENIKTSECYGYNLIHLVDSQGDTSTGGVNMHISAIDCFASEMAGAAFNAHPGTRNADYSHNIVYMIDGLTSSSPTGPSGIRSQGAHLTAVGNQIFNVCGQGIFYQPTVSAPVGMSCTIIGNNAVSSPNNSTNYNGNAGILVQGSNACTNVSSCVIQGNKANGFDTLYGVYANVMSISGVHIDGNSGVGSTSTVPNNLNGLFLRAATGFTISDFSVTNNSIVGTLYEQNIYLLGADSSSVKYGTIAGNILDGAAIYGLRFDNADYLNVEPNIILNAPTPIHLDTAFSNSMVNFGGNTNRAISSQSITSSVVLTNATNLSFPIQAAEEWDATFTLDVGTALATTGIQLAITTPASATQEIIASILPDIVTTGATYTQRTTSSGTALNFTTTNLVNVGIAQIKINVWVKNSTTAGTVQLQFSQSSSSGTAVTINAGSNFTANRNL